MKGSRMLAALGAALLMGVACVSAEPLPPMHGRTDLALGKRVLFSPKPNDSLTARGGTDATDLTDGKLGKRPDQRLWFESQAVGWSYPGRFNLAVDLGKACDIDEIAIRLQNGSPPNEGRMFPAWVEAFVSSDGEHYVKVGDFSQWNRDDFKKFDIGQGRGTSWVDCMRFKDLKIRGRWVGLRIYGTATTASDELYVFGKPAAGTASTQTSATSPTGFSVTHPAVYFHKPYLELATNVDLPVPLGITVPENFPTDHPMTVTLELPPGLKLTGGVVGGVKVASVSAAADVGGWTRYQFSREGLKRGSFDPKVFGELFLKADGWKDGQTGELRYQFTDNRWTSAMLSIPVRAVDVPAAPRLKMIMASMGWWSSGRTDWPDELAAYKVLGINTFNVFGRWLPTDPKDPLWDKLDKARQDGFFVSVIDDALGTIIEQHPKAVEIYDQFQDGKIGTHLCLSYRGKYYQEEVQRFAGLMAKIQPDFSSEDIEIFGWAGPTDNVNCIRCQADFQKSGMGSWAAWQQAKGKQMFGNEVVAAQKAVKAAGGKPFKTGLYDVRPGKVYQQVFNFDSMYPEILNSSQVSIYSSLQPADLQFIGDEVRKDRSQLPRSDVMPWLTPGDAGVFPGSSFQWATLECYANGSRGIWFWSSRMWDSEDLIAYNRVIRAIAPVEDVIVKGDLVGSAATAQGPGRVSGMQLHGRMMLLVADYFDQCGGSIKLRLKLPRPGTLRDLMTGKIVAAVLPAGVQNVTIPLDGAAARLLEITPR